MGEVESNMQVFIRECVHMILKDSLHILERHSCPFVHDMLICMPFFAYKNLTPDWTRRFLPPD